MNKVAHDTVNVVHCIVEQQPTCMIPPQETISIDETKYNCFETPSLIERAARRPPDLNERIYDVILFIYMGFYVIIFRKINESVRITCVRYYQNNPSILLILDGHEDLLKEYRKLFKEFRIGKNTYEYKSTLKTFIQENEPRDIRRLPKRYLSDILKLDEDFRRYHEQFGNKDVPHHHFFIKPVEYSKGTAYIGYIKIASYMICCCCKKSREDALKVCREKFEQYRWVS